MEDLILEFSFRGHAKFIQFIHDLLFEGFQSGRHFFGGRNIELRGHGGLQSLQKFLRPGRDRVDLSLGQVKTPQGDLREQPVHRQKDPGTNKRRGRKDRFHFGPHASFQPEPVEHEKNARPRQKINGVAIIHHALREGVKMPRHPQKIPEECPQARDPAVRGSGEKSRSDDVETETDHHG